MLSGIKKYLRRKSDPIKLLEGLRPRHWRPKTMIHVGAHLAQERGHYESMGYEKVWWIEGSAETHARLCDVIEQHEGPATHWVDHALLTDHDGEPMQLHQFTNNGASNSIFQATKNLEDRWSKVRHTGESETVLSQTLDTLVESREETSWDVLLVDVQGAELLVLQGAKKLLGKVRAVVCEASTVAYYESGVLFSELESHLKEFGFEPVMSPRRHGDVLFMRTEDLASANEHLTVGQKFRCVVSSLRGLWCRVKASGTESKPVKTCQVPELTKLVREHLHQDAGGIRSPATSGQFVEVGAYDGERFSNTSWLADSGWQGLYVEASPYYAQRCRSRHRFNNIDVVNVAAGSSKTEAEMVQNGSLTTLCDDTLKQYQEMELTTDQNRSSRRRTVPVRPLDDLLDANGLQPGFDLLVVDVEGYEEKVFMGFDLAHWRPRMLIVELCDVHGRFGAIPEMAEPAARVRKMIVDAGYEAIYQDSINTVFIQPNAASQGLEPSQGVSKPRRVAA